MSSLSNIGNNIPIARLQTRSMSELDLHPILQRSNLLANSDFQTANQHEDNFEKPLIETLRDLAQKENPRIHILLLSSGISKKDRGLAIIDAAQHRLKLNIEILFEKGELSKKDLGIAIREAVQRGFEDVVRLLMRYGSMLERDRGVALIEAAQRGYETIVGLLMKDGSISDRDRKLAADAAKQNGHKDLAAFLEDWSFVDAKSIPRATNPPNVQTAFLAAVTWARNHLPSFF